MSGLPSAVLAVLFVDRGLPLVVAILGATLTGSLIGLLYAQVFLRFGVPSFVVTLAGLLSFVGIQLYVLGPRGSINIPFDSPLGSSRCSSLAAPGRKSILHRPAGVCGCGIGQQSELVRSRPSTLRG